MKPIFSKEPLLQFRIIITIIAAIMLVIVDSKCNLSSTIRSYLYTASSPFYFLTNSYREILDNILDMFTKKSQLLAENKILQKEILLKNADTLLIAFLKMENYRLRELLGSPLRQDEHIMVTKVISNNNTPYRYQIVIDKGLQNGVYEGQAVISNKGVVGQVISVSKFNSRVLLICDTSHALPIQVLRNDIRVIAMGTGCSDDLRFKPLPDNSDIRLGDIIVTSGLGGRFPEGYPVAIISSVKHDSQHAYMIIHARPTENLQRLRYLLLLWRNNSDFSHTLSPSEVYRAAYERFIKIFPQKFSRVHTVQSTDNY